MVVSLDLVSLILYAIQQLGVMLGVGAQTILLITYVISIRDGVIDAKETQIARAVQKALIAGLALMVLSGIAITAMHFMVGQWMIIFAPAFLFKWALIIFLVTITFLWHNKPFPDFVWTGIMGATWYAMFILHIIAPVAAWFDLLVLYIVWTAGFLLLWSASVMMMHKKNSKAVVAKPAPVAPSDAPSNVASRLPAQILPPPQKQQEKKPEPKPVPPPPAPAPILKVEIPKPVPPPPVKITPAPANLPIIKPEPEKKILAPTPITTVLPPTPPVAFMPTVSEVKKPIVNENPGLPAIRVMPRTKEELAKHI